MTYITLACIAAIVSAAGCLGIVWLACHPVDQPIAAAKPTVRVLDGDGGAG